MATITLNYDTVENGDALIIPELDVYPDNIQIEDYSNDIDFKERIEGILDKETYCVYLVAFSEEELGEDTEIRITTSKDTVRAITSLFSDIMLHESADINEVVNIFIFECSSYQVAYGTAIDLKDIEDNLKQAKNN
jgi:hypothetical protein